MIIRFLAALLVLGAAQAQQPLPMRQAPVGAEGFEKHPPTLREATRNDRWLALAPREIRWSPDSRHVYFRWNLRPREQENPDLDPWYKVDPETGTARRIPNGELEQLPGEELVWSPDSRKAAWIRDGKVYLHDLDSQSRRRIFASEDDAEDLRFFSNDRLHFQLGEDLLEYDLASNGLRQLTRRWTKPEEPATPAAKHLEAQQRLLFDRHRRDERRERQSERYQRATDPALAQALPVGENDRIEDIRLSPDRRWIAYRWRRPAAKSRRTRYINFADRSGYASVDEARPKVGEPQDERGMSIVPFDTTSDPKRIAVRRVQAPQAGDRRAIVHGPFFSPGGRQALVQVVAADAKDLWISRLDLSTGATKPLVHEHDEAWLGGPPVQSNYLSPTLLRWIDEERFVFASERSGYSHLYLYASGEVTALTHGEWEVRRAQLSRDRQIWLLAASREHPCDDHLYTMPAAGGPLKRLTESPGRHQGTLSPDASRVADLHGGILDPPDLFLLDPSLGHPEDERLQVTESGTENFHRLNLTRPEVVTFRHPDKGPLWAQIYKPAEPHPMRPGALHIHGGGYRQFSHRGWSVYGWATHIGFIQHLVSEGYTVLDFDYRGSAGFGRDYRTDIHRAMGVKDVTGGVAAANYLAREHAVDPGRIGIYGLSYGGFFTLSALFKHPGVFAAGVANAAVSDWAHYNHPWTSRILNLPYEDEEAYTASSPVYHAQGLQDPLLIVHGLIDDNVQFQDAARLVQRLIELEKDFEVMFYPLERHVIQSEASRLDYRRRVKSFFARHLLEKPR